jgi:hypothetical protein
MTEKEPRAVDAGDGPFELKDGVRYWTFQSQLYIEFDADVLVIPADDEDEVEAALAMLKEVGNDLDEFCDRWEALMGKGSYEWDDDHDDWVFEAEVG